VAAATFARGNLACKFAAMSREAYVTGMLSWAKAKRISRHFFPFNSLISVTSSGNG